jgi:NADH:ubiquinone oxidoreductase subunit C
VFKKSNGSLILFLFLEKTLVNYWTGGSLNPRHSILYVNSKNFYLAAQINKNELTLSNGFLVENSAVDMHDPCVTDNFRVFKNSFGPTLIYTFYYYSQKSRITIMLNSIHSSKNYVKSIDRIYNNANWLERETSEMYGVTFY